MILNRRKAVEETHRFGEYFDVSNKNYFKFAETVLLTLLNEDIGINGDITSNLLIEENVSGRAGLIAKSSGVTAGIEELLFFLKGHSKVAVKYSVLDGVKYNEGDILVELEGNLRELLLLERTLLNFLQRLCGIATNTALFVDLAGTSKNGPLICPTRKTLWGSIDKKACLCGGAGTHRINLSDAVLVKDNHLVAINDNYDEIFRKSIKGSRFFEVEVTHEIIAEKVIESFLRLNPKGGRLYLLMDNMDFASLKSAVNKLKNKFDCTNIFFEASGGINMNNIKQYAKSGVDIISAGALTHSAPAMDISMKILETY